MSPESAELSSLATTLADLNRRVTEQAEKFAGDERTEDVAMALFDAERTLRGTRRAVERAQRLLQSQ